MNTNAYIDLQTHSNFLPALSPSMHYCILVNNKITERLFLIVMVTCTTERFNKNIIVIIVPTFFNLSPSNFILKQKIKYGKDKKLIKETGM
jgi:hypothetical protein